MKQPAADEETPCPRCRSTNTKFCYFNNKKISQPRYKCNDCNEKFTKGGICRDLQRKEKENQKQKEKQQPPRTPQLIKGRDLSSAKKDAHNLELHNHSQDNLKESGHDLKESCLKLNSAKESGHVEKFKRLCKPLFCDKKDAHNSELDNRATLKEIGKDLKETGHDLKEIGHDLKENGHDLKEIGHDLKEIGHDLKESRCKSCNCAKESGHNLKKKSHDVEKLERLRDPASKFLPTLDKLIKIMAPKNCRLPFFGLPAFLGCPHIEK